MSTRPHKSGLRSTQTCFAERLKTGKLLIFSFFKSQGDEDLTDPHYATACSCGVSRTDLCQDSTPVDEEWDGWLD